MHRATASPELAKIAASAERPLLAGGGSWLRPLSYQSTPPKPADAVNARIGGQCFPAQKSKWLTPTVDRQPDGKLTKPRPPWPS